VKTTNLETDRRTKGGVWKRPPGATLYKELDPEQRTRGTHHEDQREKRENEGDITNIVGVQS